MKKNILRVLSLVLVVGMLFSFASCTQEIHVRFVDADGNDVDISGLIGGTVNVGANNNNTDTNTNTNTTPTPEQSTSAPIQNETPSQGSNETPSQGSNETPSQGSNETPSQTPSQNSTGNKMPATTAEILEFYKKAANRVKAGEAAYTKKEWQVVDNANITGVGMVDNAIISVLGNFMTTEADASEQISEKGSNEAKDRFPACTLTDLSKIKSATCVADGGNYKITFIMQDENTPKKGQSFLSGITHSLLYWEDIDKTLSEDPTVTKILTSYSGIEVIYKDYNITAVITPDGKFVSLDNTADVDIKIGNAKILIATIQNKDAHMWNYCKYYNFKY